LSLGFKGDIFVEILRCLIADIPQKLLSDIVERITREHDFIDVLDPVSGVEDLPAILRDRSVDVLILGLSDPVMSQYCMDILKKFSDLLIIGLLDDGRFATVYLNNVGSMEIIKVICTFGGRKDEPCLGAGMLN
jgi:hypothetical protein